MNASGADENESEKQCEYLPDDIHCAIQLCASSSSDASPGSIMIRACSVSTSVQVFLPGTCFLPPGFNRSNLWK